MTPRTALVVLAVSGALAAASPLAIAQAQRAPPRPATRPATRPVARPPARPVLPEGTALGVAELNRNLRAATIAVSNPQAYSRVVVRVNINGCHEHIDGTLISIIGLEAAFTDSTTAALQPPGGVEDGGYAAVVDVPAPARPLRLVRISYFVGSLPDCQDVQMTLTGVP